MERIFGNIDERSLTPDEDDVTGSPKDNDVVSLANTQALPTSSFNSPAQSVNSSLRAQMLLSVPGWRDEQDEPPSPQPETPARGKRTAEDSDQSDHTNTTHDSEVTPTSELEEILGNMVEKAVVSRLRKGREEIAKKVIRRFLSDFSLAMAEGAALEREELSEDVQGLTMEEKMQTILERIIDEHGDVGLEELFLYRTIMSAALRTVLRRVGCAVGGSDI
ncbi:hypothetical protein F5X97DRAFT_327306 [Nemania serpens]|nr:hypothetical protein F5X97DRAFT_327306 [Nemania serpens]